MKKITIALVFALGVWISAFGQSRRHVVKETLLYSIKGNDSLYLDRYDIPRLRGEKPCMIFMFGGGFVGGNRDEPRYIPYFQFMAEQGYTVISIDYRLGLKGMARQKEIGPVALISAFSNAINMAVEDLFDATNYILENADWWNIDPAQIVTCGSSAGAISVLQAEYAVSNAQPLAGALPEGFNYAGVVSFAGAIFNMAETLHFQSAPCPVMMFHGNADSNVPYDKIEAMGGGFFGSAYIAGILQEMETPYYFYSVDGAAHEIATEPMDDNRPEIVSFLRNFVQQKERLIVNTQVQQIGKPTAPKHFTLMDYIEKNFGKP